MLAQCTFIHSVSTISQLSLLQHHLSTTTTTPVNCRKMIVPLVSILVASFVSFLIPILNIKVNPLPLL